MLHLVPDLQRHSRFVACARDDGLEGRRSPARAKDGGLIGERSPGVAIVVPEGEPSRKCDDQALGEKALAQQSLALHRWSKNPDMDASTLQGRYLLRGRQVAQLDLDVGMPPGDKSDDARAVEEVRPKGAAHEQLADFTAARPLSIPRGLLRLRDKRSRFSQEHSAGVRQFHVTLRPVKEGGLQLPLETPDLLAQGRLRDMKSRGGPPKMELFGDGEEIAQVAQLHAATHITNVSTLPGKYIGHAPPSDPIVDLFELSPRQSSQSVALKEDSMAGRVMTPCFLPLVV